MFADKSTYSMDWYYPVSVARSAARRGSHCSRPAGTTSWCPVGIHCVDNNPWVRLRRPASWRWRWTRWATTGARLTLLADMQHLRESDGSYWTGWVYEDGQPHDGEPSDVHWPVEHTTYTAAAVILAVDALGEVAGHSTAGSGIMRGSSLAPHFTSWRSSVAVLRLRRKPTRASRAHDTHLAALPSLGRQPRYAVAPALAMRAS